MIKATNAMKPQYRTLNWDEENRLKSVTDFGRTTSFQYDEKGERLIKNGSLGEVVYVSSNYTVRNGKVKGVHVFAGKTRVASKLEMNDQNEENGIYYYHADHLGSSSVVTDKEGDFYEHIEYFPYGETWINDRANNEDLPYKFTGKELDPETGLYYFGARYYDAKLSRWISADPPLATGEYLPNGNKKHDANLPGMGGVFNAINNNGYQYCGQNPVKYVDPDGNWVHIVVGAAISAGAEYLTNPDASVQDIIVAGVIGGATSAVCPFAIGKSTATLAVALKTGLVSATGSSIHQMYRNNKNDKKLTNGLLSSATVGFLGGFVSGAVVNKLSPTIARKFGQSSWMVKSMREIEAIAIKDSKLSTAISAVIGDSLNTIVQNKTNNKLNENQETPKEEKTEQEDKSEKSSYYETWDKGYAEGRL